MPIGIIASRNGGPMNPQLQAMTLLRMLDEDEILESDVWDIDPRLRLPENYQAIISSMQNYGRDWQ